MKKPPTRTETRAWIDDSLDLLSPTDEFRVRDFEGGARSIGIGVESDASTHLLIELNEGELVSEDRRSAGVHLTRRELVDGDDTLVFMDLACVVPKLRRLFVQIVEDIIERVMDAPDKSPGLLAGAVLEEWRELIERALPATTEAAARGVYGELYQLRELVRLNAASAMCWRGPYGEPHDIVSEVRALEVKSVARSGRFAHINGLEQLLEPPEGELCLAVQTIGRADDGESIPELVSSMVSLGADQTWLEDTIAKLGLDMGAGDQRGPYRFVVSSEAWFRIGEGFPRVTRAELRDGGLQPGVAHVQYDIDLALAAEWAMSEEEVAAYRGKVASA